ncbi:cryptochrome/photolyase family protein [Kaarinaea lacus]
MASYKRSLFIFRRDLRLKDNTGLIQALQASQRVIPCFIFDPAQLQKHRYQSRPGLQFMVESLLDLDQQLQKYGCQLSVFYGDPEAVLSEIIQQNNINAVYFNRDYTPFSIRRDTKLKTICETSEVAFHACSDLLLIEPEFALKADGAPYTVFTPFYRNASKYAVDQVQVLKKPGFFQRCIGMPLNKMLSELLLDVAPTYENRGGRRKAIAILKDIADFRGYDKQRDIPALQGTTLLSAHNKFGTCSIREVYHTVQKVLGSGHVLLRELYWRDFFTHIGFHFPHVFGHAFRRQYDDIPWGNNRTWFKRWCDGATGFPIVDAGMRELNQTGYMHNRVRMITASFLVKDLQIDWRWGERYFAQHLVDYDPCVNNGNWQWAASTGCDAQPYFRIFNPWLQQKKFDPDCRYIYRWIPELRDYSAQQIHRRERESDISIYPAPIVNHQEQSAATKALFKAVAAGEDK